MIYFTSDLHLGHANIIKLCNRPFSDLDEMNETLISNWNSRVTNGDKVYIVGDLIFRSSIRPETYLDRLKGKKHLILGNHDKSWINKIDTSKYFISVGNMQSIGDGKRKIILCHYPMMSWESMSKPSYLIFGHMHNNTKANYWELLKSMPCALNAGVEINNYVPVSFDELVVNNGLFRENMCRRT
ncbi:MAG: metallophosphoesterase [Saccharofermentanales bacterium]